MSIIVLVCRGNGGKTSFHSANVKPFVDLSIGLYKLGTNPFLLLHEDDQLVLPKIKEVTRNEIKVILYNDRSLEEVLTGIGPDFVIIDDDIPLMKKINNLHIKKFKLITFVQFLWGVNTNNKELRNTSMKLRLGSYAPWRYIIAHYKKLLIKSDFIIANSFSCSYLLKQFYGVVASGVVYPPVGEDIKKYLTEENYGETKKEGLLIYVGHYPDTYVRDLQEEIVRFKKLTNDKISVLAGDKNTKKTFEKLGIDTYYKISSKELVELFLKSKFTYVPTTYELFGYFGAESLLCRTPVILDVFHPFLEQIPSLLNGVVLINPSLSLYKLYQKFNPNKEDIQRIGSRVEQVYSSRHSAEILLGIISINSI